MNISLKARQVLFLYGLFFFGDGVQLSKTRPGNISPLERRPLLEMGLIRTEKKKSEKNRYAQYIYLTDQAWDWLSEHLTLPIMEKQGNPSKECAFLAEALLIQLQHRINEGALTLAEFLAPPKDPGSQKSQPQKLETPEAPGKKPKIESSSHQPAPSSPPKKPLSPEEEELLALCRQIMQEKGTDRVFLRDLRPRLEQHSRSDLDGLLLSLQQKERILLMTYQDPLSRTREDDAAALHIGSISRHVLRLS